MPKTNTTPDFDIGEEEIPALIAQEFERLGFVAKLDDVKKLTKAYIVGGFQIENQIIAAASLAYAVGRGFEVR